MGQGRRPGDALGGELVGFPHRTRHTITWPTPAAVHVDDYSSSPVELPTSQPGSPNYTHTWDASGEFYYPLVDGTQLTYLPWNGFFIAIAWFAIKNDSGGTPSISFKASSTIGGTTTTLSTAGSSNASTNPYHIFAILYHPWRYAGPSSDYPYQYSGLSDGDTSNYYVYAASATVYMHYAGYAVYPCNVSPLGANTANNLPAAGYRFNDFLQDAATSTDVVTGVLPSFASTSGGNSPSYCWMGDVYSTPMSWNYPMRTWLATSFNRGTAQTPAAWLHLPDTNWGTTSPSLINRNHSVGFTSIACSRFNLPGAYSFTGLPGRAASATSANYSGWTVG